MMNHPLVLALNAMPDRVPRPAECRQKARSRQMIPAANLG
jgi:hypothetical protein